MTCDPYVLVLSTIADVATDDVIRHLCKLGIPHKRLNTEDFPFTSTLAFRPTNNSTGWLTAYGEPIPVPTSIWYRRIRTPSKPDGMDEGIYTFCLEENRAALVGSIMTRAARWMSYPAAVWQAEFKPFQLSVAAGVGLRIPRTIITNDPSEIRAAFKRFGGMVVKPTRRGYVVHQGMDFSIFTSLVREQHLDELHRAALSPAIYQEVLPKRFDVRVTIVGRKIFAVAIDSQSDSAAKIDWRHTANPQLPHYSIALPDGTCNKLLQMMQSLELNFGAVDLVETPDGEYVFLEVNPSGQWLWLDDMLSLGISDAIAHWLAGGHES